MIVAIGFKSAKVPDRVKVLLGTKLVLQKSIGGKKGYLNFAIQDLKAYRNAKGGFLPVIGEKSIKWREQDNLLIGEV